MEVAVILEATYMLEVYGFVLNFIAHEPGQVSPDNSGTQLNTIVYIQYIWHIKMIAVLLWISEFIVNGTARNSCKCITL